MWLLGYASVATLGGAPHPYPRLSDAHRFTPFHVSEFTTEHQTGGDRPKPATTHACAAEHTHQWTVIIKIKPVLCVCVCVNSCVGHSSLWNICPSITSLTISLKPRVDTWWTICSQSPWVIPLGLPTVWQCCNFLGNQTRCQIQGWRKTPWRRTGMERREAETPWRRK